MTESSDNALAIMRLAWRIDALDEWRRTTDKRCSLIEEKLDDLTKADEIAEAIAQKMSERHGVYLTRVQTLIAVCALVVPPIISALIVKAVA